MGSLFSCGRKQYDASAKTEKHIKISKTDYVNDSDSDSDADVIAERFHRGSVLGDFIDLDGMGQYKKV